MGFGRNPHVGKAQEAELKAQEAGDAASEVRAWLEAAHLWERAAAKEQPGKRRAEYEAAAVTAREHADAPSHTSEKTLDSVVSKLRLVHSAVEPSNR